MTIFIVYSDSMEFNHSDNCPDNYVDECTAYFKPCVQAVFTTEAQAQGYSDELTHRMDSGYYAAEEYPYIKSYDVRDKHTYQDAICPPKRMEAV